MIHLYQHVHPASRWNSALRVNFFFVPMSHTLPPYNKPSLSYTQQLNQLKSRGLYIKDEDKALHLLKHLSYFRLSGYWYPMLEEPKSSHIFKVGSTFENAFKLYCFDRDLRKFLVGELEKIEVAIRAQMIYVMSNSHGGFWYSDPSLFVDQTKFIETQNALKSEYKRSKEVFIKSFKSKYINPLPPSWMILEVSSFGTLSKLYSNLNGGQSKRDIANHFGLDDSTFQSWLHSFTYLRNVCAHHSRLWNKQLHISPAIPQSPTKAFITKYTRQNPIPGKKPLLNNNRTYFLLCMVIYLLNTINSNHKAKYRLYNLFKKYPMIDVKALGFPDDWEKEELWNWEKVTNSQKFHVKVFSRIIKVFKAKNI